MANPLAWVQAHKLGAAAGAAGLVGALAWWRRRSAASTATGAATGSAGGIAGSGTGMATFDSSQLDQYNQLASAISSLNDQVQTIQAGDAAGAVGGLPPTPKPVVGPGLAHQLFGGYSLTAARTKGAVDITQNGKFLGSFWIPKQGTLQIPGTSLSIGQAGDKALGAVDVYNNGKFYGAYQT